MMDQINVDNAIHKCLENKQKLNATICCPLFSMKNFSSSLMILEIKKMLLDFLGQNVIDYGLCEEGFVESVFRT